MKERPILFSAPMVRALLAGTKTQTRRVCKGARELSCARDWPLDTCPYGKPGDRLWVRECFAAWWTTATGKRSHVMGYRADVDDPNWDGFGCDDPWWLDAKWEPSIHMPRAFSRITLEITDVRVQRLQEISREDALAEGIDTEGDAYNRGEHYAIAGSPIAEEVFAFCDLWTSINGAGSWDANPWVWAITFRRVTE